MNETKIDCKKLVLAGLLGQEITFRGWYRRHGMSRSEATEASREAIKAAFMAWLEYDAEPER